MSTVEFKEYSRKSFKVQAVQITKENILEIARMARGEYRTTVEIKGWNRNKPQDHIFLPRNVRTSGNQAMAFVGDWFLMVGASYRFYSEKAFKGIFQPKPETMKESERSAAVNALVRRAMLKQDAATYHGNSSSDELDIVVKETVEAITKLFE